MKKLWQLFWQQALYLLVASVVLMQQIGILLVLIAMASLGPSITILLKR